MTARAPVPPAGSNVDLQALRDALALTPSPEFVARVRERVRFEQVRTASGWWPKLAVASAAVGLAVIVGLAVWTGQAPRQRAGSASHARARTATTSPESAGPARVRGFSPAPHTSASRSTVRPAEPAAHSRPLRPERTRELLVPDDERRALDRLLLAMRQGRVAVPAPRQVLEDENGQMLAPHPIEIPLMRPIEPLPGMAVERPGSKER